LFDDLSSEIFRQLYSSRSSSIGRSRRSISISSSSSSGGAFVQFLAKDEEKREKKGYECVCAISLFFLVSSSVPICSTITYSALGGRFVSHCSFCVAVGRKEKKMERKTKREKREVAEGKCRKHVAPSSHLYRGLTHSTEHQSSFFYNYFMCN